VIVEVLDQIDLHDFAREVIAHDPLSTSAVHPDVPDPYRSLS
jgi:hypothetical protein